jgi:copper oxidase (laccase) domain-containing protein
LPHFFTDRRGGSSLGVYESLNLALHVGDDPATVVANRAHLGSAQFMNQVHGDQIVIVDSVTSEVPTCDGLITTKHVGRAGLVNRIALKAIHTMRSLGSIDIHAILGPSICGACYEVPFEMQQDVMQEHPRAFATTRKGTPGLDLPKALIADLVSVGVSYEASTSCTYEDEMYFSHRRQNPTGRFAGVISL